VVAVTKSIKHTALASLAILAAASAGCGDYVREGRAPVQAVITVLEGASGVEPEEYAGTMNSDVITLVNRTINEVEVRVPTVFNDWGRVTMVLNLKNPGSGATPTTPSGINQVTFTRYRVVYRRSDGRNTPGVDVPYPFDGATTFTVPATGSASQTFEMVRHIAKGEAPLKNLQNSPVLITTIAEVTFYGRDQAGNDVQATGSILIDFGDFGDPE
jgi:hypothetical protein